MIRGWLSSDEVDHLLRLAQTLESWTGGRQGTGYDKALLRESAESDESAEAPLLTRALDELVGDRSALPGDWQLWDAWLLRYPEGAHIAPHTDPAMAGHRHLRLNAMLRPAEAGGELVVGGDPVRLDVGDALVFAPDHQTHAVSEVRGERLLFSVGAWLPDV